jgi:hypothetical protein
MHIGDKCLSGRLNANGDILARSPSTPQWPTRIRNSRATRIGVVESAPFHKLRTHVGAK